MPCLASTDPLSKQLPTAIGFSHSAGTSRAGRHPGTISLGSDLIGCLVKAASESVIDHELPFGDLLPLTRERPEVKSQLCLVELLYYIRLQYVPRETRKHYCGLSSLIRPTTKVSADAAAARALVFE